MDRNAMTTEEWITWELDRLRTKFADSLNGRLMAELVSYNDDKKEVTLRFPLEKWEQNGMNSLHGGIIAAMFDVAMDVAIIAYRRDVIPPTISLTVNYLRPVPLEGYVEIVSRATSVGRTIATGVAELIICESGKTGATAIATYGIPQNNRE